MKPYIEDIIDHFYTLPYAEIDPATLHQVRRSFLDYYGCALYTANAACCKELVTLLLDLGAQGNYPIWGESRRGNVVSAAAANACRISNIEMDDGSGINAAVHPGLYVWTGALAAFQEKPCSIEQLMKAILFGYDVCMRMGMLSAKTVSQYELHGPGLSGAFGTVAAAGMVLGLSKEQLLNAFGIAGALLPLCPFISFIDGVDAKDLYGGWGVYLAMMAIEAAKRGLTGSKQIMDGTKSLKAFYSDSRGKDTALGTPYYINVIGFKEFATCLAAHPALICAEKIMHENDFTAEAITHVKVHVNMEAFQLSNNAGFPLTPTSARLCIPYVLAVAFMDGKVRPSAFDANHINNKGRYMELANRISLIPEPKFSEGGQSIRACTLEVEIADGRKLKAETQGIRWCERNPSDEELLNKFGMLTENILDVAERDAIACRIFSFKSVEELEELLEVLECTAKS